MPHSHREDEDSDTVRMHAEQADVVGIRLAAQTYLKEYRDLQQTSREYRQKLYPLLLLSLIHI